MDPARAPLAQPCSRNQWKCLGQHVEGSASGSITIMQPDAPLESGSRDRMTRLGARAERATGRHTEPGHRRPHRLGGTEGPAPFLRSRRRSEKGRSLTTTRPPLCCAQSSALDAAVRGVWEQHAPQPSASRCARSLARGCRRGPSVSSLSPSSPRRARLPGEWLRSSGAVVSSGGDGPY
jgi:hypothetical protein